MCGLGHLKIMPGTLLNCAFAGQLSYTDVIVEQSYLLQAGLTSTSAGPNARALGVADQLWACLWL